MSLALPLTAIAAASLSFGAASSVHCTAMCGPLVTAVVPARVGSLLGYSVARLAAYSALGAIAGALGQAFEAAVPTWLVPALGLLAACFLALHALGVSFDLGRLSIGRLVGRALRSAGVADSLRARSVLLGLATAVLPCGLLASVYALAAATAAPIAGAVVGGSFALGSGAGLAAFPALLRLLRATRRGADAAHWVERGVALVAAVALAFRAFTLARGGSCHLP